MFRLKIHLKLSDLDIAKSVLTRHLMHVKSSHRCEALARGLGFRTYATARVASVSEEPPLCQADGQAFCDYLRSHGIAADHQ